MELTKRPLTVGAHVFFDERRSAMVRWHLVHILQVDVIIIRAQGSFERLLA